MPWEPLAKWGPLDSDFDELPPPSIFDFAMKRRLLVLSLLISGYSSFVTLVLILGKSPGQNGKNGPFYPYSLQMEALAINFIGKLSNHPDSI